MDNTEKLHEQIQEAINIIGTDAIELIKEHFNLENFSSEGNIIKASCPLGHSDSTPSFIWNNDGNYFHCFSCSRNYSILNLLIDTEGSNAKAINKLFEMAKMNTDFSIKSEDNENFFDGYVFPPEETNENREEVETYCAKRGISKETLDHMGVKQDKYGNIRFELRDLNNKLLAVKLRPSKRVKSGEPKMWWWQEKYEDGTRSRSTCPSLFNMNKTDFTQPLLITEGYMDALSCYEAGYQNVVSIHGGAEDLKWIDFNFDYLEEFETIILWFDNDKAGQKGLNDTISRLGEYRCKIVSPTKEHEEAVNKYYKNLNANTDISKTDANNVLLACGKNTVLSLINNAKEIPSKRLKYLMDYEPTNVKDMEKVSTGFKAIDNLIYGNLFPCFTIWTGYAGCVDADTEYFNGCEWKRIADYTEGEKVLEYNIEENTAILSSPIEYIKYPCKTLYQIGGHKGIQMCLSPEHNVLWYDTSNNPHKDNFADIMAVHNKNLYGFTGKIRGCFKYSGTGIDLSDAQIKLMCAIICDGSFYSTAKENSSSYMTCRFHIKKDRKKQRLREIFNECNLKYREVVSKSDGYVDFYVTAPRREKEFGDYWYNCTQHQLQVVCDNILFWDGCTGKASKEFSTTNKKTADFVQFAFSACNIIATIQKFDRCGRERQVNGTIYKYKSIEYCVTINNKQYYRLGGTTKDKLKSDIVPLQTVDGYKYCFTMPLGTLVLRKNNRIFCSFNSGKSSIANISCLISPIENGYKTFVYSGELDNGQLSDWICSPLAGRKHILMWKNANSDRPSYSVSNQALKCIKEYYRTKIILYDDEDGLDTSGETVLEEMKNAYRRFGCRVFLIDNLMTLSFEQVDEDSRWETQKKFIKKLMGFTKKYSVCVNLIVHPKKPATGAGTEHSVYDLHGASEIGNLCHRLIWVDRLKDDEEGYNTRISIVKDRPSQAAGKECKLYYDYATRRIYSDLSERDKSYSWEQHYTITYSPDLEERRLCNLKETECTEF